MPILLPPATTDSFQGRHIEHLKNAVPDWLTGASLARINTLKTAKLP